MTAHISIREVLRLDEAATKGPLEVRVFAMRGGEEVEWSIIYDGAMSMCCFDSKPDADLFAAYRTAAPELAKDLERLVKAKSCEHCSNVGWWTGCDGRGEAEQVQCEFCCTTPDSIFNVRTKLAAKWSIPT